MGTESFRDKRTLDTAPLTTDTKTTEIWHARPAGTDWNRAFPAGNGRLGAMVFGGTANERIQINEDTLWFGEPHDYSHEGAAEHLPEIRKLARAAVDETLRALQRGLEDWDAQRERAQAAEAMADAPPATDAVQAAEGADE